MVPIDEASQVISDPKSRKKAQPVTEQPSSGPPPLGPRFNPIYVDPRSVSINSTRNLQALFPNSFDCIGDMQGEYDIKTDPTIPPVQHGRQKVPIEYKEEIKKELAEMVHQGIITKQTEPTPWVSSLMYPKKANGKLRICLDPKDLNKAIIHENHKAPTLKEIAHVLTGATKFSKVDSNKAFFGMHLTEEASLLTMFNTHLGRNRFLHIPFGLKMSQDIFQMRMDDIVTQCSGVLAIHDDMFIYGKNDRDHDANIINLFNVAQKRRTHLQQQNMCHKTGVHNILWWSLLCRGILQRPKQNSRHLQNDTTPDEARATITPWCSKLPADICPSSQLEH